jgi:hypothetical protein
VVALFASVNPGGLPDREAPCTLLRLEARAAEEVRLEKEPTKKRRPSVPGKQPGATHGQAVRFLLNVINATIYSSGEDYDGALEEFFPQVQALGHLIGARSLDDVSEFLRRRSHWW